RGPDRRRHHRDDLCVARRRAPADSVDQLSRLSARAGMHPAHRDHLRRDESADGPAVRVSRSPYPLRLMLKTGAVIVAVAAVAALAGPLVTPFDPATQELALRLAGPSATHPFGLDELGRDILAPVLAGARISFLVGLTVVTVSASVGTLLGAVAGYLGGVVDDAISRVIDVLLAFPGLLLAIALVAVLGPSLGNVLFALTIIGWVGY